MKHTPGPWKFDDNYGCIVAPDDTTVIASLEPDADSPVANALLIAAAPDLLEACKRMIAISNLWIASQVTIEHADEASALHMGRQFLLDAIAKAEGRQ